MGIPICRYDEVIDNRTCLFIICSRTMIDDHINKVPKDSALIGYHKLLLLDEEFNCRNYDFSREKMIYQIKHTIENMVHYKLLLNQLKDDQSRFILQRILLFRLTLDILKNMLIKSNSFHYFDDDVVELSDNESFLDAGGYNGDTLELFLRITKNKFENYYLFEPEDDLLNKARKKSTDNRVYFYNYGLSNKEEIVKFKSGTEGSGFVCIDGNRSIELKQIDNIMQDKRISFIKMDIEGSELAALQGAAKIIKEQTPKLAICLYHKIEDILGITDFINMIWEGKGELFMRAEKDNIDQQYILYAIYKQSDLN